MFSVTFFPVTSPMSKIFAHFALVLHAHHARNVSLQCNFRQVTASFSAGRMMSTASGLQYAAAILVFLKGLR